jgi:hypothetical protein
MGGGDEEQASAVERAHDPQRTPVDDVRVDHRRADVLVPEQALDGADVRSGFEEVRGEAVAERVTGRALVEGGGRGGVANGLLQGRLVEVVEHQPPGRRVRAGARCREEVLPREARRGARHLRAERVGKVDLAAARSELCEVVSANELDLRAQALAGAGGQEGRAVVRPLAATDGDLMAIEVDVLHAEGERFLHAESGAVEDLAEETEGRLKPVEQREDVAAREDVGEVVGALRAFEAFERGHLDLEDLAVEEDQRAQGLVLRRRCAATTDREVIEECGDLGGAHLARVTPVVEADELANPAEVRLLGARRVVQAADRGGDGFEEGHGGAPGGARKRAARGVIGRGAGRLPRAGRAVREIGSDCVAASFMGICSGGTIDCDVG